MSKLNCIIFFAITVVKLNEAAKILAVYPAPSISHQVVFRPLMQELAKRGHEVIVITTDPAFPKGQSPANLTEIDVHDLSYNMWREAFTGKATGRKEDLVTQIEAVMNLSDTIFENQMKTKEIQELIRKNLKFDLIFTEACVRPALAMSHVFKAPVIQISSFGSYGNFEDMGAPTHPFLYPDMLRQRIYNLTFWEKVTELYNYYRLQRLIINQEEVQNEMLRRIFGDDIPSLSELVNNVHMVFLNLHPIYDSNRPVPLNIVYMGGIHHKPQQKLPQDLKQYLDSSKHGVIYMSFGTNTDPSLLPPEKIQVFVKVFSELPYDVLWKWDKDEVPSHSKKIRFSKWFPQSDLLRHPKLKLFVTQGGLQSTDEAITAGVPMVGIPMLGDQWFNTEKHVFHGLGIKLDLITLNEDIFKNAVQTVINDKSYRQNVVKLRNLYQDQPQTPLERVVWWTEYVLRHGGAQHLRSPAANISWAEFLELQFVITLLLCFLAASASCLAVLYLLYRYISRNYCHLKVKTN